MQIRSLIKAGFGWITNKFYPLFYLTTSLALRSYGSGAYLIPSCPSSVVRRPSSVVCRLSSVVRRPSASTF